MYQKDERKKTINMGQGDILEITQYNGTTHFDYSSRYEGSLEKFSADVPTDEYNTGVQKLDNPNEFVKIEGKESPLEIMTKNGRIKSIQFGGVCIIGDWDPKELAFKYAA